MKKMALNLTRVVSPEETLKSHVIPEVISTSIVFSNICKVESEDAKYLCIYDLQEKLQRTGEPFDIGGTYSDSRPELWFYFTPSISAAGSHLLNLFVCHRKVGNFSISVPVKYNLTCPIPDVSDDQMCLYSFHTAQPDEDHYIKTYSFQLSELKEEKKVPKHYLPITIKTSAERRIGPEVIKTIKLEHNISGLIRKEKPDFTLVSSSGTLYDSHKLVLLAHSLVLRDKLRELALQSLTLDVTDEEMQILLDFMYTGTVVAVCKQEKSKLLELARKFELSNLAALALTMA